MANEEPRYEVLKTSERFELREYAPMLLAEVQVTADFDDVGSQSFRSLFGYISEDDRPQGEIAMTVPVLQQPLTNDERGAEESAMNQPGDEQNPRLSSYRFAFVMPPEYNLDDLPKPADGKILLRSVPSRVMAARSYSGTWSEQLYRENEQILREALQQAELKTIGTPIFARYNAPFSLWFMRRNEVLIEVERSIPEAKSYKGD